MSTDWGNAFGSGGGSKQAPTPKPEITPAPKGKTDYGQVFGGPARAATPTPSSAPAEVGLLSDEAAEALKAKAAETKKRLAEGLGKGAAKTADVAGRLGGQGATQARALVARLRQEKVGHNARVVMGAVIGLAVIASGVIEWHAHRAPHAATEATVAQLAKPAQVAPVPAAQAPVVPPVPVTSPAPAPGPVAVAPAAPVSVAPLVAVSAPVATPTPVPTKPTAPTPAPPSQLVQGAQHAGTTASPSAADISAKWSHAAHAQVKAQISQDTKNKLDAMEAWGAALNKQSGN